MPLPPRWWYFGHFAALTVSYPSPITRILLLIALLAGAGVSWWSLAAKPPAKTAVRSVQCYKAEAPVDCFLAAAKGRLAGVADPNERAEALVELLYALAGTQGQDEVLLKEALDLTFDAAVKPIRQMDLLYAIDLYGSAGESLPPQTFSAAVGRFVKLAGELKGADLVELYLGACAIVGWDEPFRERWLPFAQAVCTPERLEAMATDGVVQGALVLAMMPVAMTLHEEWEGFAAMAARGLAWLEQAEKLAAKSKEREEHEFVAFMGVLMHSLNALCLDAFERADDAGGEAEQALRALRRLEKRFGLSAKSVPLRRQVVEILFRVERAAEAKKLLREMLARVDADPKGRQLPAAEQVAVLALAARLEHDERAAREGGECRPEGTISI
jgi:hypothetical protein